MTSLVERAADILFPDGGRVTRNVKFFCAGDPDVTVNDLAEQIIRADAHIANSSARLVEKFDF